MMPSACETRDETAIEQCDMLRECTTTCDFTESIRDVNMPVSAMTERASYVNTITSECSLNCIN